MQIQTNTSYKGLQWRMHGKTDSREKLSQTCVLVRLWYLVGRIGKLTASLVVLKMLVFFNSDAVIYSSVLAHYFNPSTKTSY